MNITVRAGLPDSIDKAADSSAFRLPPGYPYYLLPFLPQIDDTSPQFQYISSTYGWETNHTTGEILITPFTAG